MIDTIKDIRIRLRQSMNGVVSSSMREKGLDYKLNFGVSLPEIKKIAACYKKDVALANTLWPEDVRELKILATLLYPAEYFTAEDAEKWIQYVRHQEIAEQLCRNLLQELPFAENLACRWIEREEEYVLVAGFLLLARLCDKRKILEPSTSDALLKRAKEIMDAGVSRPQRAAVVALKRYGRQSKEHAARVLDLIKEFASSDSPEKQEFYHDIEFEFGNKLC